MGRREESNLLPWLPCLGEPGKAAKRIGGGGRRGREEAKRIGEERKREEGGGRREKGVKNGKG